MYLKAPSRTVSVTQDKLSTLCTYEASRRLCLGAPVAVVVLARSAIGEIEQVGVDVAWRIKVSEARARGVEVLLAG
jgi:hypothetical protein